MSDPISTISEGTMDAPALDRLFNGVTVGLAVTDTSGIFTAVNARFAAILGYNPTDLVGQSFRKVVHPDDVAEDVARIREMLAGVMPGYSREKRHVRADGSFVWVNLNLSLIRDANGQPDYLVAVIEDIDQRHTILHALRDSEARLREAQRIAQLGSWELDLATNRLHWSPEIYTIFEIDAGIFEASYEAFLNKVHPDDRTLVNEAYQRSVRERATYEITHRVQFPDGRIKHVVERGNTIYAEDGTPLRSRGTVQDISAQVSVEAELRAAEERYRFLFENIPDALLLTDSDRRYTQFNPAALKMLGYTAEELRGRTIESITPPRWHAAMQEAMVEINARGYSGVLDYEHVRKNGEVFPIEVRAFLRRDATGEPTGMWAVVRDVSDRRALEEQLRGAQKMEAIGQLTGGMAHDFNNLLSIIMGNLELLAMRHEVNEQDRTLIKRAVAATQRGAKLTRRLLAFARRQSLNPQPTDAGALVRGMVAMLRRTLGEAISIEVDEEKGTWPCMIDPGQFEEAILNLAINARDAMPAGGRITVAIGNVVAPRSRPDQPDREGEAPFVRVAMTDTGGGMSAEVMARAFEPFFTTKDVGKGTGLGLSMVYGFARQSGGYVQLDSTPGRGTTVAIFLPRAREPAVATASGDPVGDIERGAGDRLLVVEDNPDVRAWLEEGLISLGYRPTVTTDGAAAIEAVHAGGDYALVLSDVVLPSGVSGFDVARTIRRLRPDLPVLLMSGFADQALQGEGRVRQCGVNSGVASGLHFQAAFGVICSG